MPTTMVQGLLTRTQGTSKRNEMPSPQTLSVLTQDNIILVLHILPEVQKYYTINSCMLIIITISNSGAQICDKYFGKEN